MLSSQPAGERASFPNVYTRDRIARLWKRAWPVALIIFPVCSFFQCLVHSLLDDSFPRIRAETGRLSGFYECWGHAALYWTPVFLVLLLMHAWVFVAVVKVFPTRFRLALGVSVGLFILYHLPLVVEAASESRYFSWLMGFPPAFFLFSAYVFIWNEILERRERAGGSAR